MSDTHHTVISAGRAPMKFSLLDAMKLGATVAALDDIDALRLAIINDLLDAPTIEAHLLRNGAMFTELDRNGRPTKREYKVTDHDPCRTDANNCHLTVEEAGRKGTRQWCIAREQKVACLS